MKNWKQFIAACLSVTMVASTPLTAFAEASVSVTDLVPKASKESTVETTDETDFEKILSQEKPYEYFSGLKDQEKFLDACKDEELFQLKEYMKYAYIHESDLKNRQSLDAYLLISESWKNRKITFEKEEQEQLLQFLEDTNVYGTKYKDGEKEKTVEDFPTYMEYLQNIKRFDVPRYIELLSAFDEAKTEDDLAKAKEAFSNFEEETYGFDERPAADEDTEKNTLEDQESKENDSMISDTDEEDTSAEDETDITLKLPDGYYLDSQLNSPELFSERYIDTNRKTIHLYVGDSHKFGSISGKIYWITGDTTHVFCLDPLYRGPDSKEYTIQSIRGNSDLLTKVMYYGYSGPGFSSSGLSTGNSVTDYYYTHFVAAYVMEGCPGASSNAPWNSPSLQMIGATHQANVFNWYKKIVNMPTPPSNARSAIFQGTQSGSTNQVQRMGFFLWAAPSNYTVTYKANGGSGADQYQTVAANANWTSKGAIYSRPGYTQTSWNTAADGSGTKFSLNYAQGGYWRDYNLTLYAQWTPNAYKLTLNPNGGISNGTTNPFTLSPDVIVGMGNWWSIAGYTPTRTGYTFTGWYDAPSGGTKVYDTNGSCIPNTAYWNGSHQYQYNGNLTVYAQWTPNMYTNSISHWMFGFQNGEGNNASKNAFNIGYTSFQANQGSTFALDANRTMRIPNGFYFSGVGTSSITGNWQDLAIGTKVTQQAKNMSFQYNYHPNTYRISYNLNGGTNNSANPSSYNVLYGVTLKEPTRAGYVFAGWYEGNTRVYGINQGAHASFSSPTDMYNKLAERRTGDITLSTKWTPLEYTIKYEGNGATGGSTASSTHIFDVAKPLTANGFSRTGYTFHGWNTKADGSGTSYTDKQSVKNLASTNGATVLLYAQWAPNTLTVRYHLNGGTDVASDNNFSSEDPARVVTYKYPSTTGKNGLYDITTARVTPPTGYLIDGHWNTKADGSGTSFDFTTEYTLVQLNKQVETGNAVVDLYAQWTPKQLVTTFHRNTSTTDTVTAQQTFTYGVTGQKFTDKKWTRTGYTLLGWADSKNATKQQYAILSGVTNAWIEKHYPKNDVYAVWKANTYTIVYDGNGATDGNTPSSNHTYDTPQSLTPNGFTRPGYIFDSWNTKPDGSGNSYQDKEKVKNLSSKDKDTVTLYAQWKPVEYKVVYKGNGSTSGTEKTHTFSQKDIEKNGYVLKTNKKYTDFARTKHTFMGWYQNSVVNTKNDMSKIYKEGSKLTYSQLLAIHAEQVKKGLVQDTDPKVKNIILYAVWDEAPGITIDQNKKDQFYEGVDVTRTELLNGITASDKIDGNLTGRIIITRIDYSAGKLVNGKKQEAYSQTWENGMPADAKLDTWFMQLDKNDSPVTHTITYQVKDSAGNITTAKKNIQVVYNEFPVIKATDFQFELKDAQAGKITKDVLLTQAITNGLVSASDVEDGDMKSKIELIDYDANAFKTMKQEGFIPITYRVQDSMGPGGKGKVTLKTVNVNINVLQREETVRYVRFINKEYYKKNANLDRDALAGKYDQIALLSVNGGLHPFSVWYTKTDYRKVITETFDKTTGTTYVYTKDDIKKMREFVKQHGVGNAKEEDALTKFADIFMTGDYVLK